MQGLRWVQLSDAERDAFLGTGGTGVISSSTDDGPPFSLPVSYGYDADAGNFYFRLSFPPDSGKVDVVDAPVSFVVHARTDEGWRSVVATGELEDLTDVDYDAAAVQGLWAVDIPMVDMFDRPPEEVSFRRYRLVPETLTGRKEVTSEE